MASNPNMFANNPLDRAAHHRKDDAWLGARLKDPSSLILPLWRLKPFLIEPMGQRDGRLDVGWLRPGLLGDLVGPQATTVFLGMAGDTAHFALELRESAAPDQEGPLADLGLFEELRGVAGRLQSEDAAIIAQAKHLVDWHRRHKFCSNCGHATDLTDGGYRRDCPNCGTQHFPRTDPVVIMLPVHGDTCLLGRNKQFPPGLFSCLAGFLEPGETIEDAVRREVREETDVPVRDVSYVFTQPWPYPASLMIGCFCVAEDTQITIDGEEIAEAHWFTRDAIEVALRGDGDGSFWVPPAMAIAHQLLRRWVEETR